MTAISAFESSDSVHVFSDGAWHDPAGKLCGMGTKVHAVPEYNAVFAITGVSTVPVLLSALLMETPFVDYQALAQAMPDLLRTCCTRGKAVGLSMTGRCDVILAGWSNGPSIFVTQCFFDHGIFKGSQVKRYIRPTVDDSLMRFPDDGLRLLEKQRAARFQRPDEGVFGSSETIGGLVEGFAQHTQVSADGIRMRVLKRWSDRFNSETKGVMGIFNDSNS